MRKSGSFLIPLGVLLLAARGVSFAHDSQAPSSIEQHSLDQVSNHVFVIHGTQQLPNRKKSRIHE